MSHMMQRGEGRKGGFGGWNCKKLVVVIPYYGWFCYITSKTRFRVFSTTSFRSEIPSFDKLLALRHSRTSVLWFIILGLTP